jgi:DNA uptake protein ComE-like DNA-binding protein
MTPRTRIAMAWDARHTAALIVICGLATLALGWQHAHRLPWSTGTIDRDTVALGREQIDPNTANNGSLQRLPGIGPKLAEDIILYRSTVSSVAFTDAETLTDVPGIGRVRARRIVPYLQFPTDNEELTP